MTSHTVVFVKDEIIWLLNITYGIPCNVQIMINIDVRRWANWILHHCRHRRREDVAKYWSIVAKHKHVIELNVDILKMQYLILQKNNEDAPQSLWNPQRMIKGNTLKKSRTMSKVDISIK